MNFDAHAFISYAHIDNAALVEGQAGWVANLERALRIRLAQRLGKESRIWRDDKLQGNEYFDETLIERLRRVAALVAVLSPRYVKSEWGRKEIEAFCDAAEAQGGVRVRDKTRLFKVLKTAVPLELHPPELARHARLRVLQGRSGDGQGTRRSTRCSDPRRNVTSG